MIYAWIACIATVVALVILLGLLSIWVAFGSAANVMVQIDLQRARAERMTKDVLILQYRTDIQERSQATSELQDTLPLWQQAQSGLKSGDSVLGLPRHPPAEVLIVVSQMQSDYVPMQVALQKIVSAPDKIDAIQAQIVYDHEHGYVVAMSQAVLLWQQYIDDVFLHIFWIEFGLVLTVLSLVLVNFFFTIKRLKGGTP